MRRVLAGVLTLAVVAATVVTTELLDTNAQVKTVYTMTQARTQAYRNSAKLEQLEGKLETKELQLQQAVKTIAMKQENMASFRWSPLLSFKFPEKPDLAEAFEFQFKPTSPVWESGTGSKAVTAVSSSLYPYHIRYFRI